MKRKIMMVVMVSFLLLFGIFAGSCIAGGGQNTNQHNGTPNGEPNGVYTGDPPDHDPANPNLHGDEIGKQEKNCEN